MTSSDQATGTIDDVISLDPKQKQVFKDFCQISTDDISQRAGITSKTSLDLGEINGKIFLLTAEEIIEPGPNIKPKTLEEQTLELNLLPETQEFIIRKVKTKDINRVVFDKIKAANKDDFFINLDADSQIEKVNNIIKNYQSLKWYKDVKKDAASLLKKISKVDVDLLSRLTSEQQNTLSDLLNKLKIGFNRVTNHFK